MYPAKVMDTMRFVLFLAILFVLSAISNVHAACLLANPSFEIQGTGGNAFGGWNQFGQTGSSNDAYHGFRSARVSGQIGGSGFWQELDSTVSEVWEVSGYLKVSQASPLLEESQTLVKIEWYNAAGNLISFDSFPVADFSTPVGQYIPFAFTSPAAPNGTDAMRLVLAINQNQNTSYPEVIFDQISCNSTSNPTIDDVQWVDFPGGRSIDFSGREWRVKGTGYYGPGPNNFSDSPQKVWVDDADRLHLTNSQIGGAWHSTEVALVEPLGYGDYIFTTQGSLNLLDKQCVLGLFIWQYATCYDAADSWWNPYNEIDIEYSRWGNPSNQIGQFVAQPWDWAGNIYRYDATFAANEISSHAFRWLSDRVEFRAFRGGPNDESLANMISSWTYTGPHIPRPEQARVHINLWQFGSPPSSPQEVIISQFTFVPEGGSSINEHHAPHLYQVLRQNYPNPFANSTEISFKLDIEDKVRLDIYDIKGRKITTILQELKAAGTHTASWYADNLPAGVYIMRLTGNAFSESRRMLLLK